MNSGPEANGSPRGRAGFTLLEVLTSLVVFALAAAVLGASYVNVLNSYHTAARALQSNEDVAFARHLVLTQSDRVKLEQGGEFDTAANRQVRWSVEIASTQTADLFHVQFTCEVTDANRVDPVKTVQNFLLLRPTWSTDVAEQSKLKEEARTRILEMQAEKAR